ncbi:hypothetical protein ACOJBM_11340 [Rhizobium beringeri]
MSGVTAAPSSAATAKVPKRQTVADTHSDNKAEFIAVILLLVECGCGFDALI